MWGPKYSCMWGLKHSEQGYKLEGKKWSITKSSRKLKDLAEMSEVNEETEELNDPPERSEVKEETEELSDPAERSEVKEEGWTINLHKRIKDQLDKLDGTDCFIIHRKYKAELCIYKVPEKLRKGKEDAYIPRVVAIGPFHRDKCAPMSEHKLYYMKSILNNGQEDTDKCLTKCIRAIQELDEAIRHCYSGKVDDYESDQLAEMMLVDGCFMLELFLRTHLKFDYILENVYESDPVLKSHWTMTALKHDLALLENQIPFFILQILYDILRPSVKESCAPKSAPKSVASLALNFFKPSMSQKKIKEEASVRESKHLLDLLHKFYFPVPAAPVFSTNGNDIESNTNPKNKQNARPAKNKWGFNYCASKILESGIEFRKGSNTEESLLDITFNQPDGIIYIPGLLIHDSTSISLFRNLIAFEQYSLSRTQSVTSYAFLMRSLISSSRDSRLLEKKGIIEHSSNGNEEYLADKFRSILDGVDLMELDDFYFRELCATVNDDHKSWYNLKRLKVFYQKQRRILWANYLSSAWKVMSILAAVTILFLTSLQTYYTIHPRN